MCLGGILHPYSELIRLKRQIGTILLFIPCTWGLILGVGGLPSFKGICLFLLGSFLLRSAGCAYNDWVDRPYDGQIKRSANRPLVCGALSFYQVWGTIVFLLSLAFLIFLNLPKTSQGFALIALALVLIYPWMKRITRWPQVVLGLAYSMGVPMGYSYENPNMSFSLLLVYLGSVLWTVFFDTIYAHQDLEDDLKVGLKSTTQVMRMHPKAFLYLILIASTSLLLMYALKSAAPIVTYVLIIVASVWSYIQVKHLNLKDETACLQTFKRNAVWGGVVSLAWLVLFF